MILSSASPAIHARVVLMEQYLPLPLVEIGQHAAALAGLVLLVLARGLSRGYASAYKLTITLLVLAGFASLLKGLDWEEAVILATIGAAAWSQSATLRSRQWRRLAGLGRSRCGLSRRSLLFVIFGTFSHHIDARGIRSLDIDRLSPAESALPSHSRIDGGGRECRDAVCRDPDAGALRTARRRGDSADARAPTPPTAPGRRRSWSRLATSPCSSTAHGGFCLYRTIGPYLTVFSDPMVPSTAERAGFLNALFAFAGNLDRRPLFYQISIDWIPLLHDRGYHFFKLGEEAHVHLDRLTLDGHAGKLTRQILRRADRDGVSVPNHADRRKSPSGSTSSPTSRRAGCARKQVVERQFSIGYFDDDVYPALSMRGRRGAGRADGCWPLPTCWKVRVVKSCRWT